MSDPNHIRQLVEEVLESQRTPEEVCADTPDLLPAVRKRLQLMKRLGDQLDEMFSADDAPTRRGPAPMTDAEIELPVISGYEVESILGRGGMGVVFKARHLKLKRTVALKMLLAGAYAGAEELARFQREAEAVAALRHPNIVQVHDAGDLGGRPYFTMEYVEGGTLAHHLEGKPQPPDRAAELMTALASAVQFAHQSGFIHRDLKPGNVLLASDGAPKISDFGLARRLEGVAELTQSGAAIGTPSYMSPEQALGNARKLGPSADIYALGAVLYELLTGRPPFHGETAAATVQQVVSQEPVPPSRLNYKVPRDLETICLKCLEKDPTKRYASAADLAGDLQRFQRGETITARRPRLDERVFRWARRHPTAAVLVGAVTLFTVALIGSGIWLAVERSHRRQGVEGDLREVANLLQQARWTEAKAVLQQADARLDGGGPSDLRARIEQTRRDLDLVIELDRIRLNRLTNGNLQYYKFKADQDYAKAFSDARLGQVLESPEVVAARVRASAVRLAVMAALDDWAISAAKERRDWVLAVARLADPDPEGWRDRMRDPASWKDFKTLAELADKAPVNDRSVPLFLALGERLSAAGGNPTPFLKRVQKAHPADFWANMVLGHAFYQSEPLEAAGYYRAALVSRPDVPLPYVALGDAYRKLKRMDEARDYFRQALELNPNYARGYTNLGNYHHDLKQTEEAIACYRKALKIDANYAWAHFDLANTLNDAGRGDEALEHYRKFYAIDQTIPFVANMVRSDLVRLGRGEEARLDWKKALEHDPPDHDAWFGYAELCLFLENEPEYRLARQDLLRRFGAATEPGVAERTARAVLLRPTSAEELRIACELADRAVAAKAKTPAWIYPYFLFAQGLAEYRQGHFERAITIMKGKAAGVMGPCPRLVIAMARHGLGEKDQARRALADVVIARDWSMAEVRSHDQWLWHVLRREAEVLIFPDTGAFLEGKHEPLDNTERLAFVGVCQYRNRTVALAQLYTDAFAADPNLVESPRGLRVQAAHAAALASAGVGADAGKLGEAGRARLRKQAHRWLADELISMEKRLQGASAKSRAQVMNGLKQWQVSSDFASLRDPARMQKMTTEEIQDWSKLWRDVEHVIAGAPSEAK
jgi:serine/threonine-protein kinase